MSCSGENGCTVSNAKTTIDNNQQNTRDNDSDLNYLRQFIMFGLSSYRTHGEFKFHLSNKQLSQILKSLSEGPNVYRSSSNRKHLIHDIYLECLRKLINYWDGWNSFQDINRAYEDMYNYLKTNLTEVTSHYDRYLREELEEFSKSLETVITVSSSLRELKTLFHCEPLLHKSFYCKNKHFIPINKSPYYPGNFQNYPNITTIINTNYFRMMRCVMMTNRYRLVNLDKINNKKEIYAQNTDAISVGESNRIYPLNLIIKFLTELIESCKRFTDDRCWIDLVDALSEFKKDFSAQMDDIHSGVDYLKNLNKFPYERYLGLPSDKENDFPHIGIKDQLSKKCPRLNVRLAETCVLRIGLRLINLIEPATDNNGHFVFTQAFFSELYQGLRFQCVLCDQWMESSVSLNYHISMYHGIEPDWQCIHCGRCFSSWDLINGKWTHEC